MKYKNIEFEAIVATPGVGKSYLCDNYPDKFVDVDEMRLKIKYFVPENITRLELEQTKGDRHFPRRYKGEEYLNELHKAILKEYANGKILICSPHPEIVDFLVKSNIKFCFVFQSRDAEEELIKRMELRGNSPKFIKENCEMFEKYYEQNINENKSSVKYEFSKGEYLENIIRYKFGLEF